MNNCKFGKTIKSYLMQIKAKDENPLFLAMEFITRYSKLDRGVMYFTKNNEVEVLSLLKYNKFWNNI